MRGLAAFSPRWWVAALGLLLVPASIALWALTGRTAWGLLGGVGVTIAFAAWQPDRHR